MVNRTKIPKETSYELYLVVMMVRLWEYQKALYWGKTIALGLMMVRRKELLLYNNHMLQGSLLQHHIRLSVEILIYSN